MSAGDDSVKGLLPGRGISMTRAGGVYTVSTTGFTGIQAGSGISLSGDPSYPTISAVSGVSQEIIGCRVGFQSAPEGVGLYENIPFSETVDGGWSNGVTLDNTSNTITISTSGKYDISANITVSSSLAIGNSVLTVRRISSTGVVSYLSSVYVPVNAYATYPLNAVVDLDAGDSIGFIFWSYAYNDVPGFTYVQIVPDRAQFEPGEHRFSISYANIRKV